MKSNQHARGYTAVFVFTLFAFWLAPGGTSGAPDRDGTGQAEEAFVFVAMGDNRPRGIYGSQPRAFEEVLEQINRQAPDFVVSTGDCVYGFTLFACDTRRQYRDFLERLAFLSCRFYSCPGNHDVSGRKGWKYFKQYIGKPYFSFRHKGSLFVLLNTEESGVHKNIVGEQLQWLKEELETSEKEGDAHRFVFMHYPMFIPSLETRKKRRKPPSQRDTLHRFFVNRRVDMVFFGHEHYYHRQVIDGIAYIITAGAGAPFYADPEEGGFHHFVKVRVNGSQVTDEVVRVDTAERSLEERRRGGRRHGKGLP